MQPLVGRADCRRVNTDIELCDVQAECSRPGAEIRKPAVGNTLAPVRPQQRIELVQVGQERRAIDVVVGTESLEDPDERGAERLVRGAELGNRPDHGRRHTPRRTERGQLGAVQLPRKLPRSFERVLDRLGADVRVPVQVTTDPAAEPQRPARAVEPGPQRALEVGYSIPEGLLEEPEALADLIDDARALGADLVGLPEQRDLLG